MAALPFSLPGNKHFNFRATPKRRINVITSCGYPTRVCRGIFELRHCYIFAVFDDLWSNDDVHFAPKCCNSQGFANFACLHTGKLFRMLNLVDLHRTVKFVEITILINSGLLLIKLFEPGVDFTKAVLSLIGLPL